MRKIRRRFRQGGKYISHTLALGQALMPAGLSVEGRFMRHACGPRRAWLKHSYISPGACPSESSLVHAWQWGSSAESMGEGTLSPWCLVVPVPQIVRWCDLLLRPCIAC